MNEKTVASRTAYDGRMLKMDVLEVELDNGLRSTREIVRHKGAVAILAKLPDSRFLLVRQFRKAVESEVLEVVAGKLEAGEAPEACAVREVKEETGYDIASLRKLGEIWPTPGYSSETIHVYYAELGCGSDAPTPEPDENLEQVILAEPDIEKMIANGEIRDGKTLSAWCMWKTQERDD